VPLRIQVTGWSNRCTHAVIIITIGDIINAVAITGGESER
jgi:hypothetical protein